MMQIAHRRRGIVATDRARRDGGYVLAKFALLLVPLLLMTGLSVDVGSWYNRIADIQKAADAAALAGVVWLPNVEEATRKAEAEATRNGFTDGVDNISVDVVPAGDRRLRVTISDSTVEGFFWSNLGGRNISLSRSGLAEYVLPVPLGSPRNYFGTGTLLAGDATEYLYQSVNPACTNKINGDRHQSLHYGSGTSLSECNDAPSNDQYRTRGYELYIEAPPGRPGNIDVLLFDPRYNSTSFTYPNGTGPMCGPVPVYSPASPSWTDPSGTDYVTITGPAEYQTRGSGSGSYGSTQTVTWPSSVTLPANRIIYRTATITWSPSASTWTESISGATLTGPARYQLRSGSSWSSTTINVPQGETRTIAERVRYRTGTYPTTIVCSDPAVDSFRGGGAEDFTFSLRSENGTPLSDADDVPVEGCTQTYSAATLFELTYLGSTRWNKLCTITTTMPDGRYVLRVTNDGADSVKGDDGSNQWGLVAKYANASGDGLCDGRIDPVCPRVYGRDAISVYANSKGATAAFFLAEIEAEHTGKTLELELWDPGEGGEAIRFLKPTGPNSWEAVNVEWTSYENDGDEDDSSSSADDTIALQESGNDRFNGKLLRIQIPLTDYNPPPDNRWWKIEYEFATDRNVTDRTTWSARVIGDPVHLLEEEAD